jgi:hypothetical protein
VAAAQRCPNCRPVRACYLVSWRPGNRVDWISSTIGRAPAAVSMRAARRRPSTGRRGGTNRQDCNAVRWRSSLVCLPILWASLSDYVWRPALSLPPLQARPVRESVRTPSASHLQPTMAIRQKLEERGGTRWPGGLDDGFPPKPPRMHGRSYRRLQALDERLAGRWCIGVTSLLEQMDRRLRRA